MSFNNSSYKKTRDLNNKNHILDLPPGIRLHSRNRLHDKNRKICSRTLFFRLNEILCTNGFTKEKIKPIPIRQTI
jgi:hypothetical protein